MLNPNTVRDIDRVVGSKICWILSQVKKVTRRNIKEPKKIKKILFIKISEMGSTVLLYPSIRTVKRNFPQAKIFFLTFKGNEEMFDALDGISKENIYAIETSSILGLSRDLILIMKKLRKEHIDAVIDFELFSRISAILSFLAKTPIQVGFHGFFMEGMYRGDFLTHKVIYNHYQHTSLSFCTLVESLKEPISDSPLLEKRVYPSLRLPRFKPNKIQIENVLSKIKNIQPNISNKRIVILNTNASDFLPIRRWPKEYFIKLARLILNKLPVIVVLTGAKKEKEYVASIEKKINNVNLVNLVGQTDFMELMTLFSISHLLITNDSGPAHFAALTPTYIITLFGPETPLLYSPLTKRNISLISDLASCPSVNAYNGRKSPFTDNKCMYGIKVLDVFTLAKKLLKLPSPKVTDDTTIDSRLLQAYISGYNPLLS